MRVTFASFNNLLVDRLNALNSSQQEALIQLASGQRISDPSDDPAAAQRVLNVRADKAQEQQYWRNAGDALDISRASFLTLDKLTEVSSRAGELAVLGSSGATSSPAFQAYGSEMNELIEQALTLANSEFQGNFLHGGVANQTEPFTAVRDANGNVTSVAYVGAASTASVRVSDNSTISPYTNAQENQGFADFMNTLVAVRDALLAENPGGVAAQRPALETAEDGLLSSIARTGGIQLRLESTMDRGVNRFASLETLIGREVDIDFAEASVRFSQAQTAYAAAVQAGARVASVSLLDYIR